MGNCILQSKRRNNDLRQRAEPFFSPFRLDLKAFLIFESIWPVFSLPRETGKGSSESFTGNHLNSWIVERQEESKEVLAIISQMKQGTMGFNWKLKPGAHLTWLWLPSGPCFTPLPFTAASSWPWIDHPVSGLRRKNRNFNYFILNVTSKC